MRAVQQERDLSDRLPLCERDSLLGTNAQECRKLYVISLTVELFHFSLFRQNPLEEYF